MKSATDQVALQLGMKTARNVSTTLRQPAFEFKLIPSLWVGGLIQAAVGGGSGGFLTNVLDWIGRRGRGFLAGCVDLVGLSVIRPMQHGDDPDYTN
jgi:hypothetical protein